MRHRSRLLSLGIPLVVAASWMLCVSAAEQVATSEPGEADPRAGRNLVPTPVYTAEEDEAVLKLFAGLRVSDVADGMDKVGLHNIGHVSPEIRSLWRDTEHFTHRLIGIAVTVRYVPANKPLIDPKDTQPFNKQVSEWYKSLLPERLFMRLLRKGSVLVIEDALEPDVGTIGSNNILTWKLRGCVGVVTDAGARDTDEITAERIPLYLKQPTRGLGPGRNVIESVNRPVVVGGALVVPGDVVVADGDGVLIPAAGRGGFAIPAGAGGARRAGVVESDRGVVVESRIVFTSGGLAEPLAVPLAPSAVVATYGLPSVTPGQLVTPGLAAGGDGTAPGNPAPADTAPADSAPAGTAPGG